MSHELFVIQNGKRRNITELIGELNWSSSIDALGMELSFRYAYNDSSFFSKWDILNVGDIILLSNNGKTLHNFIIVNEDITGRFGKAYTCFDYAWYLNKNEVVIQFNKVNASSAIAKLLDRFSIKHNISSIPTLITQIYKDQTVSDIMKDILGQAEQDTGNKYRMEMNIDTLSIKKQTDLLINPMVRLAENLSLIPITQAIGSPSHKKSIEEMKNNVIVVSDEEKTIKTIAQSSDTGNIGKYGLLTEVVTVNKKDAAQARNIAANTLKELNRINGDISLELLGHDDVRAGRLIDINEPITGIIGRYLIKSANHRESNGIHKVSIQLSEVS